LVLCRSTTHIRTTKDWTEVFTCKLFESSIKVRWIAYEVQGNLWVRKTYIHTSVAIQNSDKGTLEVITFGLLKL
jgi:hypothetical protein